jgi:aspartate carbamoyltransferase catalytic subunit
MSMRRQPASSWNDGLPKKHEAQMRSQTDSAGGLRHLVSLDGLSREALTAILDRAESYRRFPGQPAYEGRELAGVTLANLFFEPSTRTRASFDLASRRLGAHVLNLDLQSSSRAKGETMLDTIYTLEAMNTDIFVIRDSEAGMPEFLIDHVAPHVSVISAGEAHVSHPTQGLLDVLTIRTHRRRFAGLKIAIVGDIMHSRVARSTARALATLGATDLRLVAPQALLPSDDEFLGAQRFTRIEDGIAGADVVMMLRIQKERMAQTASLDDAAYFRDFGLDAKRLKLASPNALVMHPGPMNRGVEISSEVADGPRSVIREQVNNGVAVRMAVLASIAATLTRHRRPL